VVSGDAYTHLIEFLDEGNASYRLIDHAPEGRTEIVSSMRGHAVSQAAKCIVLLVKVGKKITRFVLAVVPGDARVNLGTVKSLKRGTFVRFAEPQVAERLAGSELGTILPFAFNSELELIVDPDLLENEEIFFNAGRLDRSMALKMADYMRLANPRIARITEAQASRSDQ
jgi:Ala-tRNA(Pro) deacylase